MDATEIVRTSVVQLDDARELWFYTYSLGLRRLGGVRVYTNTPKYWGPTKSGFDMTMEQIEELIPLLTRLSSDMERGLVVPPTEYARFAHGRGNEWVIQVMEGAASYGDQILDIRKHVSTEKYSGFTRKGLRIQFESIDTLLEHLPGIRESLQAWRDGNWGLFAQETETANDECSAPGSDAVPDRYRDFF